MKALYLQINHLSRMFKPEGEEGAVSLKSNLDGEKAEDDARRCNSRTKYLVTLELVCSPLVEVGVATDVEGVTAVWWPSHLVLVMGAVIYTFNYTVLPRVRDVFFFSGKDRLDGSLTAIAQACSLRLLMICPVLPVVTSCTEPAELQDLGLYRIQIQYLTSRFNENRNRASQTDIWPYPTTFGFRPCLRKLSSFLLRFSGSQHWNLHFRRDTKYASPQSGHNTHHQKLTRKELEHCAVKILVVIQS